MNEEHEIIDTEAADAALETALQTVNKTTPPAQVEHPKSVVTAAQAKIDAIADLTHSAYAKAGTLNLTKEESDQLQADFPDEAFKTGAAGKESLIYVEHAFLRDRFIKVFGMGGWAIVPRSRWAEPFITAKGVEGSRVYVEAMLVVRGAFVAEAIGEMEYYPKNAAQNYGDACEGATTAAFRRCAKNFGVGLQAWKKDWCQGWMDRKMGRKPVTATTATAAPRPAPAAPAKPSPKLPTAATRNWMIEQFKCVPGGPVEKLALEYFQKVNQLLPTEKLTDLPLRFVPWDKKQLEALGQCLANFEAGGDAVAAFEPHTDADAPKPQQKPNVPQGTSDVAGLADDEQWYDVIVPIPRKGMKRDDYLRSPDTIGSLWDARHESEDSRKRLWGLLKGASEANWVPKPREYNGKTYQPSEADKEFYKSMQQFDAWFQETHPDEKL